MHRFRQLVREIHQRSVWQVLGVYLVASWGALQVIDVLVDTYGLPGWVPPFALVLLVLGLPVVLATAIVQEGGPGRETWNPGLGHGPGSRSRQDASLLESGEPHPVLPGGEFGGAGDVGGEAPDQEVAGEPIHLRFFTWRNAVLGGVGAFALLGLAVAAYFVMWSAGIGPVGSLVAQGVLDEREPVVLADFRDAGGTGLGSLATEALRVDLVASPALTVLDRSFVEPVLQRMGRDPAERLTPELAREVAVREGIKAVLQGEVAEAGGGYLLTASLMEAESGRTLAAFRETARGDDDVIAGIDRLSERIREKAGESLRSVRSGEPLTAVTTSSLEALKKYSQANRVFEQSGAPDRALELLEEAVELDPTFAMAWRKMGVILGNLGIDPAREREALTRAYRHRDRLTERERYQAQAMYHLGVTEDHDEAIQAYRSVLAEDPDDGVALNNLALLLMMRREHAEAEKLLRRAVEGPGESYTAYTNLVETLTALGRRDEAARTLERFRERYPEAPSVGVAAAGFAFWIGDYEAADSIAGVLEREATSPRLRFLAVRDRAVADVVRGRMEAARAHLGDAVGMADVEGWHADRLGLSRDLAELDLLFLADTAAAIRRMDSALAGPSLRALEPAVRPYFELAAFYARAGRPERSRALLGEWDAEVPAEVRTADDALMRRAAVALIAGSEGRAGEAVEELGAVRRLMACEACAHPEEARALEAAGQADSAIAVYERFRENLGGDRRVYAFELPGVLERLAALHEDAGRHEEARRYYRDFAELWADADPELQPRVRRAREKAGALAAAES